MKKILLTLCFPVIVIANSNIEWFEQYNESSEESHGHYILTCDDVVFLQIGDSNYEEI